MEESSPVVRGEYGCGSTCILLISSSSFFWMLMDLGVLGPGRRAKGRHHGQGTGSGRRVGCGMYYYTAFVKRYT
jgi:hypothetical protein